MPSHLFIWPVQGEKSHAYSSFSLLLYLPWSIHHPSMCAHTHIHSQNEQQRPLMSRNAHRSVKQHDSCRSRGPPSLVGCCPQPTVAPQSDNGTPGFSRHGCVNTVQRRTGEKNNGENVAGGRQERKKKHFLLFSPDYFCCLTLHESRRGTVEEHYQWKGMK